MKKFGTGQILPDQQEEEQQKTASQDTWKPTDEEALAEEVKED